MSFGLTDDDRRVRYFNSRTNDGLSVPLATSATGPFMVRLKSLSHLDVEGPARHLHGDGAPARVRDARRRWLPHRMKSRRPASLRRLAPKSE